MTISVMTMRDIGRTHLVGGHREGVNVTLLRGVAIRKVKLQWIQQFRSHITDNSRLGCCRGTWFHNSGICDDTCDPEVPNACITPLSDQNVPLDRMGISTCSNSIILDRSPDSRHCERYLVNVGIRDRKQLAQAAGNQISEGLSKDYVSCLLAVID